MGFVFILDPSDWTVTLSHEVLELIIDPTVNTLAPGPDLRQGHDGLVLHTYEVCDAVDRTAYSTDGVLVSNFLTPSRFTIGEEIGTRNDFFGVGVDSFGVTPGSHIAYYDLAANNFVTVIGQRVQRMRPMARKPERFIHDKPVRPEEQTQSTLDAYPEGPHKKLQALPHSGFLSCEAFPERGDTERARLVSAPESSTKSFSRTPWGWVVTWKVDFIVHPALNCTHSDRLCWRFAMHVGHVLLGLVPREERGERGEA